MAKNRKLLRVGTPLPLTSLLKHLEAIEQRDDATVRHINGELVVEVPQPTLEQPERTEGDAEIEPHPFVPVPGSGPLAESGAGICDVCGGVPEDEIHTTEGDED